MTMIKALKRLYKDEEGATMVEYALMVALIAVVCIGVVTTLGTRIQGKFTETGAALGT
jgi:pilus assembly protein Flp/PilA